MSTKHLAGSVGLVCAIVASGSVFADAGLRDGADQFNNLNLTKSRADVQKELRDAKGQGTSVTMRDGDDNNLGAYGVAGSRYSRLTREEVRSELGNTKGSIRDSLYFGG